eukprot:scaffold172478_cov24-Tisochrysis_lutea.AAC.2
MCFSGFGEADGDKPEYSEGPASKWNTGVSGSCANRADGMVRPSIPTHGNLEPAAGEQCAARKAAEPGADDDDVHLLGHASRCDRQVCDASRTNRHAAARQRRKKARCEERDSSEQHETTGGRRRGEYLTLVRSHKRKRAERR